MTLSAVATRYAKALADVTTAAAGLRPEEALSQLRAFEAALAASHELQNALTTPAVPASRKRAVVARIADILKLSLIARNFLFVLIDHRRIALLGEILHSFELIVDERLGFARAEVSSPRELTESQRGAISAPVGTPHRQAHTHALRGGPGPHRRRGGAHRFHGIRRQRARPVANAGAPPQYGTIIGRKYGSNSSGRNHQYSAPGNRELRARYRRLRGRLGHLGGRRHRPNPRPGKGHGRAS